METPETNQAPAVEPTQAPVEQASNAPSNAAVTELPALAHVGMLEDLEARVAGVVIGLESRVMSLEAAASHVEAKLAGELAECLTKLEGRVKAIEGRFVAEVKDGVEDVKSEASILEEKVKSAFAHIGADIRNFF